MIAVGKVYPRELRRGRTASRLLCILAVILAFSLPVGMSAQGPRPEVRPPITSTIVTEAVGGTLAITVTDVPTPDLQSYHLIAHGDAIMVTAQLGADTLLPGAPLGTTLDITLSYSPALPPGIPDARLLAPYFSAGATWSRVDCATGACSHSIAGSSFVLAVDRVGNYALAAPELGSISVSPSSAVVRQGESKQFTATVTDALGVAIPGAPVSWQADPVAGSVDQSGLFSAAGTPGVYPAGVTATLGALSSSASIEVMPRYLYLPLAIREWAPRRTPNDPYYSWQWNMERVRAPFAWASATGAELPVIAILDTGVGLTHPDLAPRLVAGWDFVHNDSAPEDDNGHGTHVAGIAAAAGDNAIGVAGMSWNGRIMPVKVLDEHGSGDAEVAMLGVHWAVDHGATIISMSLGTTDASPYLDEAVQYAISHGAIVVAAAGNVGSQLPMGVPVYPAAFPGVIGVGATGQDDTIASFSNRGSFVDVVAPGLQVFSTWLGGGYSFQSGTSMATPHVSGLAALIWAAAPTRSAGQVASALQQGVVDLGAAGWDPIYGYGRIDAPSALARALQLSALTAMAEPAAPAAQPQGPYQAAVVLLRFATGAESASAVAAVLANGALAVETTSLGDVFRAQVPVGQEAICLARFSALPEVSWAGLDYIVFALD